MDLLVILKDNLLPFLVVLTVLIFVHEMGHYLVARWNDVRVDVFSIGFGPVLFAWTDRAGTRWCVSAIPLGGYVRMFGDADPASATGAGLAAMTEEERAVSFHHKRLGQRTAIVAAGPAANFLLAVALIAGLYATAGERVVAPHVDFVSPDSAAAEAGLEVGDRILEIDGAAIDRFEQLQRIVRASPGRPLAMLVDRDGGLIALTVTPRAVAAASGGAGPATTGLLGVRSQETRMVRHDPLSALWHGAVTTLSLTGETLVAVGEIVTGSRGAEDLGGPLRIAQISARFAELGLANLIWLIALLSINLGLINLFPIPVLDGGHLVFYTLEAIRGRPLARRIQEWASLAGLGLIISLMVFVTWNDLVQMQVFQFFVTLFS